MKKIVLSVMLSAMLFGGGELIPPVAIQQAPQEREKLYVGIGLGVNETYARSGHTDFSGYGADEYTNLGISLIAGYDAVRFEKSSVLAEVRVGQSVAMESSEDITTSYASLLLKPTFNVLGQLDLYGLLGVTYIDWTDNVDGWFSHSASGIAVGLGAQLEVSYNVFVFTDYVFNGVDAYSEYLDTDVSFDQFSVGLLVKF